MEILKEDVKLVVKDLYKTYDNEEVVKEMLLAQGFTIAADGTLELPCDEKLRIRAEDAQQANDD